MIIDELAETGAEAGARTPEASVPPVGRRRRLWLLTLVAGGLVVTGWVARPRLLAQPWLRERLGLTPQLSNAIAPVKSKDLDLSPLNTEGGYITDPNIRESVAEAAEAAAASPADPAVWVSLAEVYSMNDFNERAIVCLENAVALDANDARVYYLLGLFEYNMGNFEAAIIHLDAVLALSDYVPARWRKANAYLDLNEIDKAITIFEDVLRQYPQEYAATLGYARALLAKKQPQLAIPYFESLLGRDGRNDGHINLLLASAYLEAGNTAKARLARMRSAKGKPVFDDPWLVATNGTSRVGIRQRLDRVKELGRQGKPEEALLLLQEMYEESPDSAIITGNLGEAHVALGHWDEGIQFVTLAMKQVPDWVPGLIALSKAHYGKYQMAKDEALLQQARTYSQQALQLAPTNPEVIALDAFYISEDREYAQAATRLKEAFANVESVDMKRNLRYLLQAAMLEAVAEQWIKSIETLEHVLAIDPRNAEALLRMAFAKVVMGEEDEALSYYRQAKAFVRPGEDVILRDLATFEQRFLESSETPSAESSGTMP